MRVLVVEDQRKIAQFIKRGLGELGYAVDVADTGSAAATLAAENPYDLVILDVMLPDQSGLDTARAMRTGGFTGPLLMLSALSQTRDKVNGLDAEADDYLAKPFSMDELLARVRALMRRAALVQGAHGHGPGLATVLKFEDLEMNLLTREVKRAGTPIALTPKEFALLEFFLRHPNHVLSRTSIAEHVWDARFDSDSNVIDVTVNLLRKKIDQPYGKKLLQTAIGAGYALKS